MKHKQIKLCISKVSVTKEATPVSILWVKKESQNFACNAFKIRKS